jgi:hypothetical protein
VGSDAPMALIMQRLLPDGVFESMIVKMSDMNK